ncbi:hypothetical protein [Myxococcus sp. RHSTA-1-4]|uniref:hypothetical protein n=1 Tax=Myxococcus sp. RHSTA-1-4 TaxID=2874601 RepID=UPI001CBD8506|nr:hypothetical protein [Myxococcus sp. RHSTA-1-4]MBZ4420566.1 hypothetical protein [Myxococcus sp. RHSTA-1-4]
MSKLESALTSAQSQIPECVASGYVEMSTGMLLAVRTVDSHPREVLDLVAAATADLFEGTNVSAIERMFKKARGLAEDNHHYFQELVVLSDNLLHIFLRGKKYPQHALVFVCRKSANLGMALTKARMSQATVEGAV